MPEGAEEQIPSNSSMLLGSFSALKLHRDKSILTSLGSHSPCSLEPNRGAKLLKHARRRKDMHSFRAWKQWVDVLKEVINVTNSNSHEIVLEAAAHAQRYDRE